MKVDLQTKKGLKAVLNVFVDKKSIQEKMEQRLEELKNEVSLKGFRPGKVPSELIKKQFGKAIYGEVLDKVLKETSSKAILEKKIKIAGQPRIDLKSFGEGKDLTYEIQVDTLPEINLKSPKSYKADEYEIIVNKKIIDKKINEIVSQHKEFQLKKDNSTAQNGDQITFDYLIKVNNKEIENGKGRDVQLEIGKDLFIKGFDKQLIGVKKNQKKIVKTVLPPNYPNKEFANKNAIFECDIKILKEPKKTELNDDFAKQMGAKNIKDLENMVEKQIEFQYKQALEAITKKQILDQLDKSHKVDLPKNLVDNEINGMTQNLKPEEKEKFKLENEIRAKSRIKLGLLLNEYGEKNNLNVSEIEIQNEINKQLKTMPGQEKLVLDYYKKNPMATQSIKGTLYEEKILNLIKSKMQITKKKLSVEEADKLILNNNQNQSKTQNVSKQKDKEKSAAKSKKISKK